MRIALSDFWLAMKIRLKKRQSLKTKLHSPIRAKSLWEFRESSYRWFAS
jgi:hypothetical protein